jgi:hypothetical protein
MHGQSSCELTKETKTSHDKEKQYRADTQQLHTHQLSKLIKKLGET